MNITTTKGASAGSLSLLVYGAPGVGKTRLCATTGVASETLILSVESGLLSLREYDIDVATIATLDDLREAFKFLRSSEHGYKWVCLDSVSELAEVILAVEKKKNAHAMKAYGETIDIVTGLVRGFRDLPINVYLSAKAARVDTEDGSLWGPSMPGKRLSQEIGYFFDEVFALRTSKQDDGTIKRAMQTQPDGHYVAKDRSGALELFEPANLQHIAAKIAATGNDNG